jgi:hypothetical protein
MADRTNCLIDSDWDDQDRTFETLTRSTGLESRRVYDADYDEAGLDTMHIFYEVHDEEIAFRD